MRMMALDIGEKTVGVAVCDELRITVSPRETLRRDGRELDRLADWIAAEEIGTVVAGLPVSLNGSLGPSAERAMEFVGLLRAKVSVPVETWDERLTTAEAEKLLISADVRRSRRRKVVDQLAAVLILESYLRRLQLAGAAEDAAVSCGSFSFSAE
jgi:putative Holliday junction resolvase